MFRKIIFTLAWIGIFIISLGGIYLGLVPQYLYNTDFYSYPVRISLIAVAVVYLLLAIEKFLSIFEKPKGYDIKTENGKLIVSSSSINNLVKEVVAANSEIEMKNVKVTNRIRRKNLYIMVKVETYTDSEISQNLSELQKEIKDAVFKYLEAPVESVEIKVSKLVNRKTIRGFASERGEE